MEIKRLFSVVLLHFFHGSREAYHNHAFDAVSWVLKGKLVEFNLEPGDNPDTVLDLIKVYTPGLRPIITRRNTFHQVHSVGDTWVLSFRGPWARTWREYLPAENRFVTLTHGRREVA